MAANPPNSRADSAVPGMSGRFMLSANSHAARTTKTGLRISDGCTDTGPTSIQRVAPLITGPMKRVETSSPKPRTATTKLTRRTWLTVRKDAATSKPKASIM